MPRRPSRAIIKISEEAKLETAYGNALTLGDVEAFIEVLKDLDWSMDTDIDFMYADSSITVKKQKSR